MQELKELMAKSEELVAQTTNGKKLCGEALAESKDSDGFPMTDLFFLATGQERRRTKPSLLLPDATGK